MDIKHILNGIVTILFILAISEGYAQWHAQPAGSPGTFTITTNTDRIIGLWKINDGSLLKGKLMLFTPDGQFFMVEQKPDGTIYPVKGPSGTWRRDPREELTYGLDQTLSGYTAHIKDDELSVVDVDDNYGDIQGHIMEKMTDLNEFRLSLMEYGKLYNS